MSRNLFLLAIAASLSVALPVLPQMASAQPSALRPMQDAQRKAEQKARQAKKKTTSKPIRTAKHSSRKARSRPRRRDGRLTGRVKRFSFGSDRHWRCGFA